MHMLSLGALVVATLFTASAAPAFAHAGISPASAPLNATIKAVLTIPHGCDGAPTDTVLVKLPEGFVNAKPQAKPGWQIEVTRGAYARAYDDHGSAVTEGALAIAWSGGALPDDQFDEFIVQGQFQGFDAETVLPFLTTQKCGAAQVDWTEIAAPGQNPHALAHPAPTITVTLAAAGGEHDHGAMAGMTSGVKIGELELSAPFARATLPNQPVGGGYVTITNNGAAPDRLVSATSPAAGMVEIHEMRMEGDVMKMRALPEGVEIAPGQSAALAPGGLHLMFMQLNGPFKAGDSIPVTLTFEKAGSVEIALPVLAAGADAPAHDHKM